MIKIIKFEFKRLFSNKIAFIINSLLPIFILFLFSISLLPIIFTSAKMKSIDIALLNQDDSLETKIIVSNLINAESIKDIVNVVKVGSFEQGEKLLEENLASALVVMPKNLRDTLYTGGNVSIKYYSNDNMKDISNLVYAVLQEGVSSINKAQLTVDVIYTGMQEIGYSREISAQNYRDLSASLQANILSRSKVFISSKSNPFGDLLNIEYYSITLLILTLFLSSISISVLLNKDLQSQVLSRGVFAKNKLSYCFGKLFASMIFLMLQMSLVIVLILWITQSLDLFSGNISGIIMTSIFFSLYISSIMLAIGSITKYPTNAVWISFIVSITFSFISGSIIPRSILSSTINRIGEFTALPAISRLYSMSLFGYRGQVVTSGFISGFIIITICLGVFIIKSRRGFNNYDNTI